jgi:calcineurin-like phosphoesterase family protein
MRTLAIGDIHGCLTALKTLLDYVAPAADDRLALLGDYVDRGPDSRGVLDLVIGLRAGGRVMALRGNHDQMMTEARGAPKRDRHMWLACGGRETLKSYGVESPESSDLKEIPESHWTFLERDCLDCYEIDRHFFVHANAYPDVPLDEQPRYMLLWEKIYEPCVHVSGKVMVCGHTRQIDGRPRNWGAAICIDTGAYDPDGWLTCLDVATGRYWQANQQGQRRTDLLEEPTDSDL